MHETNLSIRMLNQEWLCDLLIVSLGLTIHYQLHWGEFRLNSRHQINVHIHYTNDYSSWTTSGNQPFYSECMWFNARLCSIKTVCYFSFPFHLRVRLPQLLANNSLHLDLWTLKMSSCVTVSLSSRLICFLGTNRTENLTGECSHEETFSDQWIEYKSSLYIL